MFICDPGLANGIAELAYDPVEDKVVKVSSSEGDLLDVGVALRVYLNMWGPEDSEVVAERFTITEKTAKNTQAPWSLEVLGAMRWLVADIWELPYDKALILQSPSEAQSLVSNEILQHAEVWHVGGEGHAKEALRHGMYRYARHGVRTAWAHLLGPAEDS